MSRVATVELWYTRDAGGERAWRVDVELNPDSVVPMRIVATSSSGGSVCNVEWLGEAPSACRTSRSAFLDRGWEIGSYQCSGEDVIGTHGPFLTCNGSVHIEADWYRALLRRDGHDGSIDVPSFGYTSGYNALTAFAVAAVRPWAVFAFLNMKWHDYGWLSVIDLDEASQLLAARPGPLRSRLDERSLFPSGAEVGTEGLEPFSGPRVESVSFSPDGLWLAACLHEHVVIYELSDWPMYGHRLRDYPGRWPVVATFLHPDVVFRRAQLGA